MWSAHTHALPLQKLWQRLVSVVEFKPCPGKQVRTKGGKWCADQQYWANRETSVQISSEVMDRRTLLALSSTLSLFIRSSLLYKCLIDLSSPHTRRHFEGPSNFPWEDSRVNWNKISRKSLVIIPLKKSDIEKYSGKAVLWMKTGTLLFFPFMTKTQGERQGHNILGPPQNHIYYGKSSKSASVCVPLRKGHTEFNSKPRFKCLNVHIRHSSQTGAFSTQTRS